MTNGPRQPVVRPWKKRERITAKRTNETVDAVNALLRGANGGRQVSPIAAGGALLQRFQVVSVGTDVVVCRTWDGTTAGTVDVDIALPYLLQRTPFDGGSRDGVSYTYTSNTQRNATDGVDAEVQRITPPYIVDDELFAIKLGTIVGGTGIDSDWLDLNPDSRAWAAT